MARLDSFFTYLTQEQGNELRLRSDAEPELLVSGTPRPVTKQKLSSGQILMLIKEIIPPETLATLQSHKSAECIYVSPHGPFVVKIVAEDKNLLVTMARYQHPSEDVACAPEEEEVFELQDETARFEEVSVTSSWEEGGQEETICLGEATGEQETIHLGEEAKEEETIDPEEGESRLNPPPIRNEPAAYGEERTLGGEADDGPDIQRLLLTMVQQGGSDLHLGSGERPVMRKDGDLIKIPGFTTLGPEDTEKMLLDITPERSQRELKTRFDTDFVYEMKGAARFRTHLFQDRSGVAGVFRLIPTGNPLAEGPGLPPAVQNLCLLHKGLVVVTGPTGSGKSTTLAALIDFINRNRTAHVITIEDPIEFLHEPKNCLVRQREVGTHTGSFAAALRASLREDPDIMVLGALGDSETIALALNAVETDHLVIGVLDAPSAASAVDKLIEQYPLERQALLRPLVADSLKGVVAQALCRKTGGGRIAALEVLVVTPPIASLIREGKAFQIPSLMKTGAAQGMMLLNDALLALVNEQVVAPREAYGRALDKTAFAEMLKKNGCDMTFLNEMEGRPAS